MVTKRWAKNPTFYNRNERKYRNVENRTLVEKLNNRIAELEADNKSLMTKVRKYEKTIEATAKAKKEYEAELKSCKDLAAVYTNAINEAQKTKRALTEQMQKEIADFRAQSKKLLKNRA